MYMNPMSEPRELNAEEMQALGKSWWVLLLLGIATLIAGFILLGATWSLGDVALFFGIVLIIRGLLQIFSGGGARGGSRGWNIVVGILTLLVGIAVLIIPVRTLVFIATFVGVWLIVTGLIDIVGSIAARKAYPYWWLALIRGIIAVPLGFWALGRPFQTLALVIFVIGIWAITIGIIEVVMSFEVRRLAHATPATLEPQTGAT